MASRQGERGRDEAAGRPRAPGRPATVGPTSTRLVGASTEPRGPTAGRTPRSESARRGYHDRHAWWHEQAAVEVCTSAPWHRRPRGDDALRRHARSRCWCTCTRPTYLHGDRPLTPLLRLPEPVHRLDADARASRQNTLQMLVGWELVGLCSFVLIGHWWEEKPNTDAALKAFLTNRVGDMGLIDRRDHHCSSPPAPAPSTSSRINEPRSRVERRTTTSLLLVGAVLPAQRGHRRSRASSRCTRGCPTPWPARPRSRP